MIKLFRKFKPEERDLNFVFQMGDICKLNKNAVKFGVGKDLIGRKCTIRSILSDTVVGIRVIPDHFDQICSKDGIYFLHRPERKKRINDPFDEEDWED